MVGPPVGGTFRSDFSILNPFYHLQSCIANGDTSHLYMAYEQNRESQQLHISGMFFQLSVDQLTAKELAVNFISLVMFGTMD